MGLTYPLIPELGNCYSSPVRYFLIQSFKFPTWNIVFRFFYQSEQISWNKLMRVVVPCERNSTVCIFVCARTQVSFHTMWNSSAFSVPSNNNCGQRFICNINHYTIYMKHLCVLFKYARTLKKRLTHIVSTKTSNKNVDKITFCS